MPALIDAVTVTDVNNVGMTAVDPGSLGIKQLMSENVVGEILC